MFTREGLLPAAEALSQSVELTPEMREQEVAAHLSASLSYYDTILLDEGFLRMTENPQWLAAQRLRYKGGKIEKIIENRGRRRDENLASAQAEFVAAYRLNHPELDNENLETEAAAAYEAFETEFRGGSLARMSKRRAQRQLYESIINAGAVSEAPFIPAQVEPDRVRPAVNPRARNSLARAIRAEYMGYAEEDFQGISSQLMAKVHPANLLLSLVNVGRSSKNSRSYIPDGSARPRRVTFTPAEWKIILRTSAEAYAGAGENTAETKRKSDLDVAAAMELPPEAIEDDADAPRRAGIHTIKGKATNVQAYIDNILIPQLDLVHRFQEACDHPGLARFGNEGTMRQQLEFFFQFVVGDMLWAAARVQNAGMRRKGGEPIWSAHEELLAPKAVRKPVFMVSEPRVGRKNFKMLADAAEVWLQNKLEYALSTQADITNYLNEHQTEEEQEADERERLTRTA
jgi:hypothetical protein